jgi:hypothetical protein
LWRSSKDGAAVAARFTYGALGSDTGGSIRPPRARIVRLEIRTLTPSTRMHHRLAR